MKSVLKNLVNGILAAYVLVLIVGLVIMALTVLPILKSHNIGIMDALLNHEINLNPVVEEVQSTVENDFSEYAKKLVVTAFGD